MSRAFLDSLKYDDNGLVSAIIQDADTGEVLMFAFSNREALEKTIATGKMHFWSRSRKKLWMKGEESGHVQEVREIRTDCDRDALLIKVQQTSGACHEGFRSCFSWKLAGENTVVDGVKLFDPKAVYKLTAPMEVLYEDADVTVVNKPAGLPVIPGRHEPACVIAELCSFGGTVKPLVVHRLDQDTSGVLLIARNVNAQRMLSKQFGGRLIEKTYHALVAGVPDPREGDINAALETDPERPLAMKVTRRRTAKSAHTAYRVIEEFRGLSLVELRPTTGRTHQLRVHMKSIGYPLAVDPLYGSNDGVRLSAFKRDFRMKRGDEERPIIGRLTLHAFRVRFRRPSDEAETEVEAPYPKDLLALQALRKWAVPSRRRTATGVSLP